MLQPRWGSRALALEEGVRVANMGTSAARCDHGLMADRQSRNVSLPPAQDAFVDAMVAGGRYRTVSEVVRDGLRLLETAEHRRLLEKWLYEGLTADEEKQLPGSLKERARAHIQGLVDTAMQDVGNGRVSDGPTAMERLRKQLEARPE